MLDSILQGLREVAGVQGAMIVDYASTVVAHRAHTIYDLDVLQQVARSAINAAESVQLLQDEWEVLTAHFSEGKLILRNVKAAGAKPRRYVLAVIGDATLNLAFLGVALRVAAGKLVNAFDAVPPGASGASGVSSASGPTATRTAMPSAVTGRMSVIDPARPAVAKTGVAWTGGGVSTVDGSGVETADASSSAFLTACTTALAASQGPIAKVFVREAVRKVCVGRPFSRADGPALLAQLATLIDDAQERATFQRSTRTL
jgi:predicted regulator of Ras-like GTPase activity (Roadblock/LC7/MglB family)